MPGLSVREHAVGDIIKAVGVPKGSFYNHFKSKEDLGAEVVSRYTSGSGWQAEYKVSPLQQLRAVQLTSHRSA